MGWEGQKHQKLQGLSVDFTYAKKKKKKKKHFLISLKVVGIRVNIKLECEETQKLKSV